MITHNLRAWEREKAVNMFSEDALQAPEQAIFNMLPLASMSVLDIGIGAGRTTHYLASRCKHYIGVDYSAPMIEAAKQQFPSIALHVADARSLPFQEHFDFILFSFNGIDNMPHEDRITTLNEIKKSLKPGGYFAFSSHNIFGAKKLFHIQWNRKPRRMIESAKRWYKTRTRNPSWSTIITKDNVVINEGAHALNLQQYYIKPKAQIEQLSSCGFTNIRVLDLEGAKLQDPYTSEDNWIYYLCTG